MFVKRLTSHFITGLLCAAAVCAGLRLSAISGMSAIVWVPSGLALASAMIFGSHVLVSALLGTLGGMLVISGWMTIQPIEYFTMPFGVIGEAALGAWILKRPNRFNLAMSRISDVVSLLIFGSGFSAAIATGGLAAINTIVLREPFWSGWSMLWVSHALGIILVAPFFFVWSQGGVRAFDRGKGLEALLLLALVTVLNLYVFEEIRIFSVRLFPFMMFPLLVWACLRFDQLGGVTTILSVAAITVYETAIGHRAIAQQALYDNYYFMNTYLPIFASTGLFLASSSLEKKRAIERAEAGEAVLKTTEAKLKEALMARDEFLSIASHELKTPLTSVVLQVDLAHRRLKSPEAAFVTVQDQLSVFELLSRQLKRLTKLIDDLLDTSTISMGRFTFAFVEADLSDIVRDVMAQFSDEFARAGCSVKTIVEDNVFATVDVNRMEQVLVNLLSNAVKYAAGSNIRVELKRAEASTLLVVEDDGPGIPLELQHKIFERFGRASSRNFGGLGLGLFIVKEVVEGHGGDIAVNSAPGRGSRFTVTLNTPSINPSYNPS